jgi:hypothetical protein
MENYQWFLLGVMTAWLPGMLFFAHCLWCAELIKESEGY